MAALALGSLLVAPASNVGDGANARPASSAVDLLARSKDGLTKLNAEAAEKAQKRALEAKREAAARDVREAVTEATRETANHPKQPARVLAAYLEFAGASDDMAA